jgi:hypothetical protein
MSSATKTLRHQGNDSRIVYELVGCYKRLRSSGLEFIHYVEDSRTQFSKYSSLKRKSSQTPVTIFLVCCAFVPLWLCCLVGRVDCLN